MTIKVELLRRDAVRGPKTKCKIHGSSANVLLSQCEKDLDGHDIKSQASKETRVLTNLHRKMTVFLVERLDWVLRVSLSVLERSRQSGMAVFSDVLSYKVRKSEKLANHFFFENCRFLSNIKTDIIFEISGIKNPRKNVFMRTERVLKNFYTRIGRNP